MKKKLTLLSLFLSSLLSPPLQAAQASMHPFTEQQGFPLFYHISNDTLSTSLTLEGLRTPLLNVTTKPFGVEDERKTFGTLMASAETFAHSLCFILYTEKEETHYDQRAFVVTNEKFEPLGPIPAEMIPWRKIMLFQGGKGYYFSPQHIAPPTPPTVVVEKVPVPFPVQVERPYPVYIDREVLVPAPYPVAVYVPGPVRKVNKKRRRKPKGAVVEHADIASTLTTTPVSPTAPLDTAPLDTEPVVEPLALRPPTPPHEQATRGLQQLLISMQQSSTASTLGQPVASTLPFPAQPSAPSSSEASLSHEMITEEKQAAAEQKKITEEQEKIRSVEAEKKAQKDAQLKQIEEATALRDSKRKEEETRKMLAQQKKEREQEEEARRTRQSQRDKEAAAAKKAEQEAAKQQERTPHTAAPHTSAASDTSSKTSNSPAKKEDKKAKETAALEKARAQADTKRAALAAQQARALETQREITKLLEEGDYAMAKALLGDCAPDTAHSVVSLMEIYLHEPDLLGDAEVIPLMIKALKFANDEQVDKQERSLLFWGCALHEKDVERQEEFLHKCLMLDRDRLHFRAGALYRKIKLKQHESTVPRCTADSANCPHTEALTYTQTAERQGSCYPETRWLTLSLLAKAILRPKSCCHLAKFVEGLGINPREYVLEYYNRMVRNANPTETELAEINRIVTGIVPADKLLSGWDDEETE